MLYFIRIPVRVPICKQAPSRSAINKPRSGAIGLVHRASHAVERWPPPVSQPSNVLFTILPSGQVHFLYKHLLVRSPISSGHSALFDGLSLLIRLFYLLDPLSLLVTLLASLLALSLLLRFAQLCSSHILLHTIPFDQIAHGSRFNG